MIRVLKIELEVLFVWERSVKYNRHCRVIWLGCSTQQPLISLSLGLFSQLGGFSKWYHHLLSRGFKHNWKLNGVRRLKLSTFRIHSTNTWASSVCDILCSNLWRKWKKLMEKSLNYYEHKYAYLISLFLVWHLNLQLCLLSFSLEIVYALLRINVKSLAGKNEEQSHLSAKHNKMGPAGLIAS